MNLQASTFWRGTESFYRLDIDVKPLIEIESEKKRLRMKNTHSKECFSEVPLYEKNYECDELAHTIEQSENIEQSQNVEEIQTEALVEIFEIIPIPTFFEKMFNGNDRASLSFETSAKPFIKIRHIKILQFLAKQVKNGKEIIGRWHVKSWNFALPTLKYVAQSVMVSMLIFFGGYLALNYQAYFQVLNHYWKNSESALVLFAQVGKKTNLQTFVARKMTFGKKESSKIANPMPILKNSEDMPIFSIVSPDNRIIIPKIDKNIPIVETASKNRYDENWLELEKDILSDLKYGVVHYPGTANPGQKGDVVMTGHSSYYPWDDGKYKDVFALLDKLEISDEIIIYFQQKEYQYKVTDRREVNPDDINVLEQKDGYRLSLITCAPLGTNLRRLIVTAEQVR